MNAYGNCKVLYAHWEKQEHYGRTTKTTYYRYVVAYNEQEMYVSPLNLDRKTGQIQLVQPFIFNQENLGKVTVNARQKNGATTHLDIWLGDKQGQKLLELYVDVENLNSNRWFPFNILQQEECDGLEHFLTAFTQRVADVNPDIEDVIKANNNESTSKLGSGLAIAGAIVSILFAPIGLVMALIGLILSIVSKKRALKAKNL